MVMAKANLRIRFISLFRPFSMQSGTSRGSHSKRKILQENTEEIAAVSVLHPQRRVIDAIPSTSNLPISSEDCYEFCTKTQRGIHGFGHRIRDLGGRIPGTNGSRP